MVSDPGRGGRAPSAGLAWPQERPAYGAVTLRAFEPRDVAMVRDMSTDPYVPHIGSLPADADEAEAADYIARQRSRHVEGIGYAFCIADAATDHALGQIGLWLADLAQGRATAGYTIAPRARGRGAATDALIAVTAYGWTIPGLHRISLHIEPWNTASIRTAERAGYEREGQLRSWLAIGNRRADVDVYGAIRP